MRTIISEYKFHVYVLIITLIALLTIAACSDNPAEAQEDIVLPEKDLNFEAHIKPLFINKCANRSGCHSAFEPANGLNLTDYQTVMTHFAAGTERLVIPGQADLSFLYNILRGPMLNVPRMPLEELSLNSNNINGVKTWINEGAEQFP